MKLDFISTSPHNTRIILIFTGWSTGPEVARDIRMDGWDVAVAHDFSSLTLDTSFLDRYYTVYLFAWSLGVFAASRLLPPERITAAFAINGTTDPVDDDLGIPVDIFKGTLESLDSRNLMKFRMRMAGGRREFAALSYIFDGSEPDVTGLKSQLGTVLNESSKHMGNTDSALPWVRAFVSQNDLIFPPANMRRAWQRDPEVKVVELDSPHYVSLDRIIRSVISDPAKVSARFNKASVSYDTHAIAQYSAAIKLAGMLADRKPPVGGRILEIGCGTGLFTHEYAPLLRPDEATFVDIATTGPFGIAPTEEYVVMDAELWLASQQRQWDVILSASAIQWFADIPRFLHECHEHLTDGGLIAISTFVPGNMEELDSLRPSPLIYPKAERLREWLERDFDDVDVVEDEIRVEFRSVRDMLMHLKHTGVGGSAPGTGLSISDMSHLRSLTYRPVYLLARKHPLL